MTTPRQAYTTRGLIFSVLLLVGSTPALAQCPSTRIEPSVPSESYSFGNNVAISGRHLFISDSNSSLCSPPDECLNGAIHWYEWRDGAWLFRELLIPADAGIRHSANTMKVDGDRMIVGADGSDLVSERAGAAYIFDFDGQRWVETGQIGPVEPRYRGGFGGVVEVYGSVAFVEQDQKVYVYEEIGGQWVFQGRIDPPEPPALTIGFGVAMEASDEWLFISATHDQTIEIQGGAVYVYKRLPDGRLEYRQKLTPPDILTRPRFGNVSLSGNRLLVGGYNSDDQFDAQGAAYVFELQGDRWEFVQQLRHENPRRGDNFGSTVFLRGDRALIGALSRFFTGHGGGAAFVFDRRPDGQWVQRAELLPETWTDSFSTGLAFDGNRAVVGARREVVDGEVSGAAHAFDLSCIICKPDLDLDGALTIFDFLTFLNLFQDADPLADFDGDGELTIFDFLAFQTAFDAGCA